MTVRPNRLAAIRASLLAERDRLARELAQVDGALAALEVDASDTPARTPRTSPRRHVKGPGPTRMLLDAMRARPGEEFTARRGHDLLVEQGWESESGDPVNVIRASLNVLDRAGEITKLGRGRYACFAGVTPPATGEDDQ